MRIRISLPSNRDYCGELEVFSADGHLSLGPFPVAARAHDDVATLHQNSSRHPLLPYGDTPCGRYRVKEIVRSSNAYLGAPPVVVLLPLDGDAALADANGRFFTVIHGDAPSQECLRATCGSLRLFNAHQEQLAELLRTFDGSIECVLVESLDRQSSPVDVGSSMPHLSDPVEIAPARMRMDQTELPTAGTLTRREALAKAAIITIAGSSIFVAQAKRAEGQVTQYTTPSSQPTPDLNDQRAPDLQDIHVSPPPMSTPEPATPEPATPESATPEAATPEPATPEPATPEPATPEPATPEPATPEPLRDAPNDQATATPRPTLPPMNKYGTITVKNNTDPPEPIRFLVDGGTQTTAQPGFSGTASMILYGQHTVTVYVYLSFGPNEGKKICQQDVVVDQDHEDVRLTCP